MKLRKMKKVHKLPKRVRGTFKAKEGQVEMEVKSKRIQAISNQFHESQRTQVSTLQKQAEDLTVQKTEF